MINPSLFNKAKLKTLNLYQSVSQWWKTQDLDVGLWREKSIKFYTGVSGFIYLELLEENA